jgi:hypothetical protein
VTRDDLALGLYIIGCGSLGILGAYTWAMWRTLEGM